MHKFDDNNNYLGEQIRGLLVKNEEYRNELVEREKWKKADLAFAEEKEESNKRELSKMRVALQEIAIENKEISQSIIKEHGAKEKLEKSFKGILFYTSFNLYF